MPKRSSTGIPRKPGSTAPDEYSPLVNVPSTGTAGDGGGDDLDAAWDPLFDTADDVGAPIDGGDGGGSNNSSLEKKGGSRRRTEVPSPSILPPPSHITAATAALNAAVQQQQQPLPPVQLRPVITQTSSTLVAAVSPSTTSQNRYHQQPRVNVPPLPSPQQLQSQQSQVVPQSVPSTMNTNVDVLMMIPVSPLASNMVLGSPAHSESMMIWSPTTRGGGGGGGGGGLVGRASSQSLIDHHGGRQGVSNAAVVMNKPRKVLQGFSLVNEKEEEEVEVEEDIVKNK